MLRERIELSYSHVALGCLTEKALATLFASSLVKALVQGSDVKPTEIKDARGQVLYPAFYRTHLVVRPERFLEQNGLWSTIEIGSQIERWGSVFLESRQAMSSGAEATGAAEADAVMSGSVLFTVDAAGGGPQPSAASLPSIQRLPALAAPPTSLERFSELEARSIDEVSLGGLGRRVVPFVVDERGAAPVARSSYRGHTMLFSNLIDVLDHAETAYLRELTPGFTGEMLARRSLLERELVFFSMPRLGERLEVAIDVGLGRADELLAGHPTHGCAGRVEVVAEVLRADDNTRVAASRCNKMLAVENARQDVQKDVRRVFAAHGKGQS